MTRGQRWWIVAGLCLSGAACGYRGAANGVAFPAAEETVSLNFVNEYGVPLKIYTVESGTTRRVGTIFGQDGQVSLRIDREGTDSVQVIVQPLGEQRRLGTGPMLLPPGGALDFTITRPLTSSTAAMRP